MNAFLSVPVAALSAPAPDPSDWRIALVLGVVMGIASMLVLPYASALTGKPLAGAAVATAGARGALFAFLFASVGLALGAPVGLDAPLVRSWIAGTPFRGEAHWLKAAFVGAVAGFGVLLLHKVFFARVVASAPKMARQPTRWQGALASFGAGIEEEIEWRLGVMTVLAWGIAKSSGSTDTWVFMTAITVAAVGFGAVHLRLAAKISGSLSTIVVLETVLLNTLVGIVFGVLYWRWGLEHAMVAHFCADIVIHVIVHA
jgi:hypothetical protein